jgi:hypothetical protein
LKAVSLDRALIRFLTKARPSPEHGNHDPGGGAFESGLRYQHYPTKFAAY